MERKQSVLMKGVFLALVALSVSVASAKAGLLATVYNGVSTYGDYKNLHEEAISLNGVSIDGHTVYGTTKDAAVGVLFTSTDNLKLEGSQGNARIMPDGETDELINDLTFSVSGYYFDDFIFSVQPDSEKIGEGRAAENYISNLVVTVTTSKGVQEIYEFNDLKQSADQDFLVLANEDILLSSITLTSIKGFHLNDFIVDYELFGLNEAKQFAVSGLIPVTAVPEPATMLLFGTGIAGLAGIARRKRD